jgi:hypothetical protein
MQKASQSRLPPGLARTQQPQALFATPMAIQSAGDNLTCKISTNSARKAPDDPVQVTPCTMVGKHMVQTYWYSIASSPGGTCSTPLVPAVTTSPIGATPATGKRRPFRPQASPCLHVYCTLALHREGFAFVALLALFREMCSFIDVYATGTYNDKHTSLVLLLDGSSHLVAHVLHYPPPPTRTAL